MRNVNIQIGRKKEAFIVFLFHPIVLFDPNVFRLSTRSSHLGGRENLLCQRFVTAGILRYTSCNLTQEHANIDLCVTPL